MKRGSYMMRPQGVSGHVVLVTFGTGCHGSRSHPRGPYTLVCVWRYPFLTPPVKNSQLLIKVKKWSLVEGRFGERSEPRILSESDVGPMEKHRERQVVLLLVLLNLYPKVKSVLPTAASKRARPCLDIQSETQVPDPLLSSMVPFRVRLVHWFLNNSQVIHKVV